MVQGRRQRGKEGVYKLLRIAWDMGGKGDKVGRQRGEEGVYKCSFG